MAVKKTILIVDDQEQSAEIIRDFLQMDDSYRIFTVHTGADAYAKIKNVVIDLIITDYMMPKMSGVELYSLVRSSKLNANIPVIFISGWIEKVLQEIKREPLIEFLPKPVNDKVLWETVKRMLATVEQANEQSNASPIAKPQVDVSIMNQFIGATVSTLSTFANLNEIKNGAIQAFDKTKAQRTDVSGMISMNCEKFNGSLIVSFPVNTILGIHNKILDDQKQVVDDDVADTVGELVNIIWGRTKKLLESENLAFTSTLPVVFQETKKFMGNTGRTTTLDVPFHTELGELDVLFSINF